MKTRFSIFLAALVGVAIFFGFVFTPVKLEQVQAPHHVFYIELCGVQTSAIITVDPPIYVSENYLPTESTLALMAEAIKERRVSTANLVLPGCSLQVPEEPAEII